MKDAYAALAPQGAGLVESGRNGMEETRPAPSSERLVIGLGLRVAELQLRIIWEEILKRFDRIEVVGEPKRVYSSFVRGIESLPVRIPA